MTAFVIASLAGGNLVFDPTWTTLDSGDEVLSGWNDVAFIEWTSTPDAVVTVTSKNDRHSFAPVWLSTVLVFCRWMRSAHVTRMVQWQVASHLHRQVISTLEIFERHW
jgi:hypothetical protein